VYRRDIQSQSNSMVAVMVMGWADQAMVMGWATMLVMVMG
jgi:hypothetical protein